MRPSAAFPDAPSPVSGDDGWGSDPRARSHCTSMNELHVPVLLERCLELLAPALAAPGAVVVDATLGLGGHPEAMLGPFDRTRLVGVDRDRHALALAGERLARFVEGAHLAHTVYDRLPEALEGLGIARVAGILFDLGVSSIQLDEAARGFSYAQDAPLDMRMDDTSELTAARILAEYDEAELRRIFWEYGDEKLAPRYARRIVEERRTAPIETSARLVAIIDAATPAAARRPGPPSNRVAHAPPPPGT